MYFDKYIGNLDTFFIYFLFFIFIIVISFF